MYVLGGHHALGLEELLGREIDRESENLRDSPTMYRDAMYETV